MKYLAAIKQDGEVQEIFEFSTKWQRDEFVQECTNAIVELAGYEIIIGESKPKKGKKTNGQSKRR